MKCYYDFHIHSGLSPCAEDEMSPGNVVNMALLKGLNAIALTDHNSIGNLRAFMEAGQTAGLLVVPGMELQTREEVHLLCLFQSLDDAQAFSDRIEAQRMRIPNKPERFGNQVLYNSQDEPVGEYPWSLLSSIDIGLEDAVSLVRRRGAWPFPVMWIARPTAFSTPWASCPRSRRFLMWSYPRRARRSPRVCRRISSS